MNVFWLMLSRLKLPPASSLLSALSSSLLSYPSSFSSPYPSHASSPYPSRPPSLRRCGVYCRWLSVSINTGKVGMLEAGDCMAGGCSHEGYFWSLAVRPIPGGPFSPCSHPPHYQRLSFPTLHRAWEAEIGMSGLDERK